MIRYAGVVSRHFTQTRPQIIQGGCDRRKRGQKIEPGRHEYQQYHQIGYYVDREETPNSTDNGGIDTTAAHSQGYHGLRVNQLLHFAQTLFDDQQYPHSF